MHCHGNKCPLLTAFLFLSPTLTFLLEGVIVRLCNFAWGFKSQNNMIWGERKKCGGPPSPLLPGGQFFYMKSALESIQISKFVYSPSQDMCTEKFPLVSMGG